MNYELKMEDDKELGLKNSGEWLVASGKRELRKIGAMKKYEL